MAEIQLPRVLTQDFLDTIPYHRAVVNQLLVEGKIRAYSLSADRSTLWIVLAADDLAEAEGLLERLPLRAYFEPRLTELMFHNAHEMTLAFSLN